MSEELSLVRRPLATPSLTLRDLLAILFRQKTVFLVIGAVVFVAVLSYGWLTPSYRAHMKVLVRRGRIDPVVSPVPSASEFQKQEVSEEDLNSEVELLRDEDLLTTVANDAGLASQPGWWGRVWNADPEAQIARAVRRLGNRLEVEPMRKTRLISVSYAASDPAQAAYVLRCLANSYLERHQQLHRISGESQFFDQQMWQAADDLTQAEVQMMDFSSQQGVVSASLERDLALQKLSEATSLDQETSVRIAETTERVRALESKFKAFPEQTISEIRIADNPELLKELQSRLLELQIKRTELVTKFQPTYRPVQEIDRQIDEAKQALSEATASPLRDQTTTPDPNHEWAKSEMAKAQVELSALTARSVATGSVLSRYRQAALKLGDRAIEQEELQRKLKAAEDRYLLYASKREEARIGDALDEGGLLNVTIAEQPSVPALPARSTLQFVVIGLVLAATAGTGTAFAADYLDPSFRTPDEVLACLGTPVLASLPSGSEGRS